MNKKMVIGAVHNSLIQELEKIQGSIDYQEELRDDSPGAMQSRYDTMKTETSWLLNVQNNTFKSLLEEKKALDSLGFGSKDQVVQKYSLVLTMFGNKESIFFVTENFPGKKVEVEGKTIQTITQKSPIGVLLAGKKAGDKITFNKKIVEIIKIF